MKKNHKLIALNTEGRSKLHHCPWDGPNVYAFLREQATVVGDSVAKCLYIVSDGELSTCNGLKREGASCSKNNNCKYPDCNLSTSLNNEIRVGDWCINVINGELVQAQEDFLDDLQKDAHLKVIASNDRRLTTCHSCLSTIEYDHKMGCEHEDNGRLPGIDDSFVKEFVKRGGDISEVQLLYSENLRLDERGNGYFPLVVKHNNTVSISEKESDPIEFIREIKESLDDKSDLSLWETSVKRRCEEILKQSK